MEEARNPFQFDVIGRNQSAKLTPPRLKDLLSDIITLAKKVQRPAITTIHREQVEPNRLTGELYRPVGETEPNRLTGELYRPVEQTEPNRLTGELFRPVGETEPNRLTGELYRPVEQTEPNRLTRELSRPVEQTEQNQEGEPQTTEVKPVGPNNETNIPAEKPNQPDQEPDQSDEEPEQTDKDPDNTDDEPDHTDEEPGQYEENPLNPPPNNNMARPAVSYERPKPFKGAPDQDPTAWMERFEIVAQHNRWQNADKVANFPLFLEDAAAGWYRTQNPPNQWLDTQAANGIPFAIGLKNAFLNVFKPADYKRYQEQKLMKRAQGLDEPLLSYYFNILELCQNVDPAMPEERKVGHLLNGLKPTLAEKIIPYEVTTAAEFLDRAKILVRAVEFANTPGRNPTIVAAAQAKIMKNLPQEIIDDEENPSQENDSVTLLLKTIIDQQQAVLAHTKSRRPEPAKEPKQELSLMEKLTKIFIDPPEIPKTNEDRIIEGIQDLAEFKKKYIAQQQHSSKGNYRGNERNNFRGGKRGNYNNYNGNHRNNAQQRGYKDNNGNNQREPTNNGLCHYCKEPGHIRPNCPLRQLDYQKLKEKEKPAPIRLVNTNGAPQSANIGQITTGPLVIQQVVCNGLEINAIIDTGASLSAISPALLKRFNSEGKTYNGPLLIMASGQEVKPEKEFDIIIEHPSGATAKATVAVLELTGEHLLLGNDILQQFHKITVEYKDDNTATLLLNIQVKNSPEVQPKQQLIAKEACQVPARSIKAVPVFGIRLSKSNAVAMIEPAQELAIKKGISPGHALINGGDTTTVLVANTSGQDQWIGKRTVVGTITEVTTLEVAEKTNEPPIKKVIAPVPDSTKKIDRELLNKQIAPTVSNTQRQEIQDLITEFSPVFASTDNELGVCNVTDHTIDTGDAKPIFQHPFSTSWKAKEIIQEQVADMEKRGIIERSFSPWASPVVLVKKPDGTWRFCVDYRKLNSVTKMDLYPIPNIEAAL